MSDRNDALAQSGYSEEEQRAIKEVLRKLGLSETGMTEEEFAEFFEAKTTKAQGPMDWPNFSTQAVYVRAGIGIFDEDGVFRFTYQKYPDIKDLSAYLELRAGNLVTWDGMPRNPARG
jgi:hypothetical protein